MRTLAAVIVLLALSRGIQAQEPQLEKFLAPFDTVSFGGLFGTQWSAELWVRNDSDTSINLLPERCSFIGLVTPCESRYDVPARSTVLADVAATTSADFPGLFLYVPRDRVKQVHFNLRIRDLAKAADSYGTQIPIVRVSDFPTGAATLLNVPVQLGTRLNLRVFINDSGPFITFMVRIYGDPSGLLLADREFRLNLPTDVSTSHRPIQLNMSSAFAGLVADRVRVVIEGEGNAAFWPMLTITNNRTSSVTVVTPR